MAEAQPPAKRGKVEDARPMPLCEQLLAALRAHPRPADSKAVGYGTAGFRGRYDSTMEHIFLRVGIMACLRAAKLRTVTGVMVTASHNAEPDNGAKICEKGGDMMDQSWEPYAADLANLETADEVIAFIAELAAKEEIDMPFKAEVYVAMDTRPSGPAATALVVAGAEACGAAVQNFGVATTPQLHYMVMQRNAAVSDTPTMDMYYAQLVAAYKEIVATADASSTPLVVDCANGVGAKSLTVVGSLLSSELHMQLRNVGGTDGLVNEACGAEFVQKEKNYPRKFGAEIDTQGARLCSLDGDADRLVYFYTRPDGTLGLLDGDKIAALAVVFIKEQLQAIGADEEVSVGVVQTAYANGGSSDYMQSAASVPVRSVPTGVKHLHKAAHEFDVGVYFEANGHGTVLFSSKVVQLLGERAPQLGCAADKALRRLQGLTKLINQAVGDAVSDMLMVEAILRCSQRSIGDWDALYTDRPSRMLKVAVADRAVVKPQWDERRLDAPVELQAAIDSLVAAAGHGARAFARPSGTEDVVRVYAEAQTSEGADELALQVLAAVHRLAGGIGEPPSRI